LRHLSAAPWRRSDYSLEHMIAGHAALDSGGF
jgi:hypothetical protein